MAGTATPVAAAAPAPSAPAAPPSSPASPPPAPPAAPPAAPPSAPPTAPEAPVAAPGTTPEAPAAPPAAPYDPKTAAAPPKATDYPNTTEGQGKFATEMNRWYAEHPEGEKPAPAAEPAKTPEQQALADAAPPEPAKPAPAEVAATPQQLAEMMNENPAFKDFMEANPKVKGPVFQMARELAAAKPIAEMFPSVDDAKFAQEYSAAMVGLKTASMRLIDNPDAAGGFLEAFDSQFQRLDAEGKPVMENGKPVFDADRDAVRGAIFNARLQEVTGPMESEISGLKTKLAGAYPSDFARAQDQARLDNLEYAQTALAIIPSILDGSFFEGEAPALPEDATPQQKAWFEQETAKLKAQREELDATKRGASKEERTAQAQQFQSNVRGDMGTSVGTVIDSALKAVQESGVYIPEFYMQEKYVDPATGKETQTSAIAARLFLQFENDLMRPGSRTLMEIAQHELLPQNEQTREIRKNWYARKASEIMPGLVQKEVDRIQGLVKLDQTKQAEMLQKRNQAAQPEPSSGGSSLPQGASEAQIRTAAEEAAKVFAKKEGTDWDSLPGNEKQARIITQHHRMQRK